MLLDDCAKCVQVVGGSGGGAGGVGTTTGQQVVDACCTSPVDWGTRLDGTPFDSFEECCAEGCFDLPSLGGGGGSATGSNGSGSVQGDDCPDCWSAGAGGVPVGSSSMGGGGGRTTGAKREDDLTESGSSVATPADSTSLAGIPNGLSELMSGLDEKSIQEIVSRRLLRSRLLVLTLTQSSPSSTVAAADPSCK